MFKTKAVNHSNPKPESMAALRARGHSFPNKRAERSVHGEDSPPRPSSPSRATPLHSDNDVSAARPGRGIVAIGVHVRSEYAASTLFLVLAAALVLQYVGTTQYAFADTATFTVSATPEVIEEGEITTLMVAISNGVTFADEQTFSLTMSGTTSPADYEVKPATLTLAAGESSVTAELEAIDDDQEEEAETVTVTASHGGVSVGSATVTITSVSHDATLSDLSLSGIYIGEFSAEWTSYSASVDEALKTTTVTATASHPRASVSISPAAEVRLEEGENVIAVTVAAEDGITTQTYTVTVFQVVRPLTGRFESVPQAHSGSGTTVTLRMMFSEPVSTGYQTLRNQSLTVTNGDVQRARQTAGRSDLWDIVIAPSSDEPLVVVVYPTQDCADAGAVCTAEGKPLSNYLTAIIPGPPRPEVSIASVSSPVMEGTAVVFDLTLDEPAAVDLSVSVNVTESGSTLSGAPPTSVMFAEGDTSVTLSVPTEGDAVVEADSIVTATVMGATGYAVGQPPSAAVTVEGDDAATFTVSATPETIAEGESATVTVAISNGVAFAEDQTVTLALSGSASSADYTGVPAALTLLAGTSSVTADLAVSEDQEEEAAETVTVAASHGGVSIGSATLTITSVSHDATLNGLSLSGIDIGAFSGDTTTYTASVANDVSSTTVSAEASHANATVSISPAAEVSLAAGTNKIAVTVTAEDGTTTKTYTVTVTRASVPLTASFESMPASHDGENAFTFTLTFSEDFGGLSYRTLRDRAFEVDRGTVRKARRRTRGSNRSWTIEVKPDGHGEVSIVLPQTTDCDAAGAVCTAEGKPLSMRLELTIPWAEHELPVVSIVPVETPIAEGERGKFKVTRTGPTMEKLTVEVRFTLTPYTSQVLTLPVVLHAGMRNRTPSFQIFDDNVVRGDITVIATLEDGEGYTVSAESASAAVILEENDIAEFALSVDPDEVAEGDSATVTVAISNGVTFAEDQTIALDFAGSTARRDADYTVSAGSLTLVSGASSVAATLTALVDSDEETDETVSVTARHGGKTVGTETVTVADGVLSPLTASFESMPASHDGENAFTFTLTFSEDFGGLSYRTLRDRAFEVDRGTVRKARRRTRGSNRSWTIGVKPDGHGEVSIVLPQTTDCDATGAICTTAGRKLSQSVSVTVNGPVAFSVADGRVEENDGALLAFTVTLNRAETERLTVDYATSDGSAQAGVDYAAARGTLTFAPGETEKTVEVTVLDDSLDEGEETLTLTLSRAVCAVIADATATGTIVNSDPIPRAWLARFGRTVAKHVLEGVEKRMTEPRTVGTRGRFPMQNLPGNLPMRLDGVKDLSDRQMLAQWMIMEIDERGDEVIFESLRLTEHDLVTGTEFSFARGGEGGGFAGLWGRGAYSSFDGRDRDVSLNGEVTTAMAGADYAIGKLTAGLSVVRSWGQGSYSGSSEGDLEMSLNGVYPYVGYGIGGRFLLWGVVGYGRGDMELAIGNEGEKNSVRSDIGMKMGAAGGWGELLSAGAFGVALKGDGLWVRTTSEAVSGSVIGNLGSSEADVTRLRLGVESTLRLAFGDSMRLVPSFEAGVRHDGGDAERGFGVDMGGGVSWSYPAWGISAEFRVRGLVTHEAEGFREWGASGSVIYDADPGSEKGLRISLAPSWGEKSSGGTDALWGIETAAGQEGNTADARLEGRMGYGFLLPGEGLVGTPEFTLGYSGGVRDYRMGYRMGFARGETGEFDLGIEAHRRENSHDARPEHGIKFKATLRK